MWKRQKVLHLHVFVNLITLPNLTWYSIQNNKVLSYLIPLPTLPTQMYVYNATDSDFPRNKLKILLMFSFTIWINPLTSWWIYPWLCLGPLRRAPDCSVRYIQHAPISATHDRQSCCSLSVVVLDNTYCCYFLHWSKNKTKSNIMRVCRQINSIWCILKSV